MWRTSTPDCLEPTGSQGLYRYLLRPVTYPNIVPPDTSPDTITRMACNRVAHARLIMMNPLSISVTP